MTHVIMNEAHKKELRSFLEGLQSLYITHPKIRLAVDVYEVAYISIGTSSFIDIMLSGGVSNDKTIQAIIEELG